MYEEVHKYEVYEETLKSKNKSSLQLMSIMYKSQDYL